MAAVFDVMPYSLVDIDRRFGCVMAQAVNHRHRRRSGFAPGSVHMGFVVDVVALEQIILQLLRVSP